MPATIWAVIHARWTLMFMTFSCFFVLSCQRINMSIAIVSMVNWTVIHNATSNHCPTIDREFLKNEDGEFFWKLPLLSQVLASYFYGLILMQLPSEVLVQLLTPEYASLIGIIVSTICNFVTPIAARWDSAGIILVQIIKAMGHAVVLPSFSLMLGKWIPTKQLIRSMSYATSAIPIGAFFTVLLAGTVCNHPDYGWPYLFYASGTIGAIWCLMWFYLCFDVHFMPVLIANSCHHEKDLKMRTFPIPLKQILTSKAFWGYVASGIASYWMMAMNLFVMPVYFKDIFELGIEWNGVVSSLPNALHAVLHFMSFSILLKETSNKTAVRRLVACTGLATFATCMVLLTFVKCHSALGVSLMAIGVGAAGCGLCATSLIAVDMSHNFAGISSNIMNTIGAIAGCGLPIMVGYLTSGNHDVKDWEIVFYASGFVTFISMILFMAYSSCEIQPWNKAPEPRISLEELMLRGSKSISKIFYEHPRGSSSHTDSAFIEA